MSLGQKNDNLEKCYCPKDIYMKAKKTKNKFNITNPIYDELIKYKLITDKNILKLSRTRDKKIPVYFDKKTKLIFLERCVTDTKYYNSIRYLNTKPKRNSLNSISNVKASNKTIKVSNLDDDMRRSKQFSRVLINKNVLDFGCGWGGFLNNLSSSKSLCGVELRQECHDYVRSNIKKIDIRSDINLFDCNFDVITMFHVLEHIPEQVKILKSLKNKLNKKGKLIIEVPHAEDFLFEFNELKEFKEFTFWSEHLVLHTSKSLTTLLQKAGFKNVKIDFYQRFGLDNHLGWFIKKKPGGHDYFRKFSSDVLNDEYGKNLIKLKKTDTLIATAY